MRGNFKGRKITLGSKILKPRKRDKKVLQKLIFASNLEERSKRMIRRVYYLEMRTLGERWIGVAGARNTEKGNADQRGRRGKAKKHRGGQGGSSNESHK